MTTQVRDNPDGANQYAGGRCDGVRHSALAARWLDSSAPTAEAHTETGERGRGKHSRREAPDPAGRRRFVRKKYEHSTFP